MKITTRQVLECCHKTGFVDKYGLPSALAIYIWRNYDAAVLEHSIHSAISAYNAGLVNGTDSIEKYVTGIAKKRNRDILEIQKELDDIREVTNGTL